MPEMTVKHNVKDATPPEREVLPSGNYHANIIKAMPGVTRFKPERMTLQIEYQVVKTDEASIVNGELADKYAGRGVYQDYIVEPGGTTYQDQKEAFRIQQLMAATGCPYKEVGNGQISFNTDHLLGKSVKITVTTRAGKKKEGDDPKAPVPLYNNVERVDSEVQVDEKDLV